MPLKSLLGKMRPDLWVPPTREEIENLPYGIIISPQGGIYLADVSHVEIAENLYREFAPRKSVKAIAAKAASSPGEWIRALLDVGFIRIAINEDREIFIEANDLESKKPMIQQFLLNFPLTRRVQINNRAEWTVKDVLMGQI